MKSKIGPVRPTRSQSELQSDSKTLRYEIENLVGIAEAYSPIWFDADRIRNNAYIAAFALHCRALIFFLFGHQGEIAANGSCRAASRRFLQERHNRLRLLPVMEQSFCSPPTGVLVEAKRQADKHVAHITEERRELNQAGSPNESIWKLAAAASAICAVMGLFLDNAPANGFDEAELARMKNSASLCKLSDIRHPGARATLAGPRPQAATEVSHRTAASGIRNSRQNWRRPTWERSSPLGRVPAQPKR